MNSRRVRISMVAAAESLLMRPSQSRSRSRAFSARLESLGALSKAWTMRSEKAWSKAESTSVSRDSMSEAVSFFPELSTR